MIYAILFMIMGSGGFFAAQPPIQAQTRPLLADLKLAALFTPRRPQLGRYEVLTSPEPLSLVIQKLGRAQWTVETLAPLDAFGDAGAYDKSALAQLYGGLRASVSRGWIQENGQFESLTFISPYPDPSLTRLNPGTLIIRFIICCT
jgi:hypothetical protein